MPVAITALFDERTEAAIHALRLQLVNAGFGDAASATDRPHLTLAILDAVDGEALREPLRAWCLATQALPVEIAALGTFPGSEGVIYLSPVITEPLLEMHARVHALLARAGLQGHQFYRPGHWVPRVTVAIGLSPAAVGGALTLVREAPASHTGVLTQIAVAQFPPLRALYCLPLGGEAAPV